MDRFSRDLTLWFASVGGVEILDLPLASEFKAKRESVSASGLLGLGLPGLSDARGPDCLADAVPSWLHKLLGTFCIWAVDHFRNEPVILCLSLLFY